MRDVQLDPVPELSERVVQARGLLEGLGRPVLVRGGAKHWPALDQWAPEQLSARFGDESLPTYVMPGGRVALDAAAGFRVEWVRLRDYVAELGTTATPERYLRADLRRSLRGLAESAPAPPCCVGRLRLRQQFWFSGAGVRSHLHFDLPHNVIAMVQGRKRFILFAPNQRRHLYPHPWLSSVPHLSRIDAEQPDLTRYPAVRDAQGYACDVEPGDLLYVPSRWWHYARSLTLAISTNFWWSTPPLLPLLALSDAYKRMRGLNI